MIKKNYIIFDCLDHLLASSEFIDTLKVPKNFEISIFAENLNSPRQITETSSGHSYSWLQKRN